MGRICIGVATKPQALKGQFRLKPNLLNLKNYKKIKNVEISGKDYVVESVSLRDTFVVLKLQGVDTCEIAETFRNREVFAEMEEKVESHLDLMNYKVTVDSKDVGIVEDINNYGSKDILSIVGEESFMIPVIDDLIVNIDENNHIITLNKNIFEQVAVYED